MFDTFPPCSTCGHPTGVLVFVIQGPIGTHFECEWCYAGTDRPPEPVLITDTFTEPPALTALGAIIDKLTGTSTEHGYRAARDTAERAAARSRALAA
jgi:hypothetical protein